MLGFGREKVGKDLETTSGQLLNFEGKRMEYEAMYKTTKTIDFLFLIFLKFCLETMHDSHGPGVVIRSLARM